MAKQMCQICGEHEAEYQCDYCGKLVCQHCIDSNFACDECSDKMYEAAQEHSIFGL